MPSVEDSVAQLIKQKMSYYAANEEDDIYLPTRSPPSSRRSISKSSSRRSSSKSSSKHKRHSSGSGQIEVDSSYRENNAVGNYADPEDITNHRDGGDQHRKSHRRSSSRGKAALKATGSGEFLSLKNHQSTSTTKKTSSSSSRHKKSKSRQEQVYDDLYGGTNYQEVDDGIVGCADDLCVNKADYIDTEEDNINNNKNTTRRDSSSSFFKNGNSPNIGADNKVVDDNEEVYIVKQRYGYFSIFFGVVQIIVLSLMMWQCGVAPMNINPMFGPYPDALSEWGGKNSVLIVEDGEWWRLLTPILLHAGAIHLFCNVAVQLELGVFFEREWGSLTWLIIYLTSAVGSSVLSVITMPDAVSVGSSGAVMGLFGGKIAEVICRCCEKTDTAQDRVAHQVRKEQCIGVTCSVVVVLAFSFMPYVDWAAHLGGLIAGMFVGFMCFSVHMESYCLRLLWFVVGMGLTVAFFGAGLDLMYSGDVPMTEELRDVCGYYTQNFEDYECNCMREEYLANINNFFNDDDNAQQGAGEGDGGRLLYQTAPAIYRTGY